MSNDIILLLQTLTPVIVALIGIRAEYNRNADKKVKKLEAEAQQAKDDDLKETISALANQVAKIDERVTHLSGDVDTIKHQRELTVDEIKNLTSLYEISGKYIHELASLVMVLAEGMRDQHLDGNITTAIANYRKFESDTLSNFIHNPKSKLKHSHDDDDE